MGLLNIRDAALTTGIALYVRNIRGLIEQLIACGDKHDVMELLVHLDPSLAHALIQIRLAGFLQMPRSARRKCLRGY